MPGSFPSGPPGLYIQARDCRWLQVTLISHSGKLQCEGETISHFLNLRRGKWKIVPSRKALPYLTSGLIHGPKTTWVQRKNVRQTTTSPTPSDGSRSTDDTSSSDNSSSQLGHTSPIISKPPRSRVKEHRKSSTGHDENDASSSSSSECVVVADAAAKGRPRNGLQRSSEIRQIDEMDASSSDGDAAGARKPLTPQKTTSLKRKPTAKKSPPKRKLKLNLTKTLSKKARAENSAPPKSSSKVAKDKQTSDNDESSAPSSSSEIAITPKAAQSNDKLKPQTRSASKNNKAVTNATEERTENNEKNDASTASSDAAIATRKPPVKPSNRVLPQSKKLSKISPPKTESEHSSGDDFNAQKLKPADAHRRLTRTQLRESPREKLDLLNSLKLMSKTEVLAKTADDTKKRVQSNLAKSLSLRRKVAVAHVPLETTSDEELQVSQKKSSQERKRVEDSNVVFDTSSEEEFTVQKSKKSPENAVTNALNSSSARTLRPRLSNQDKSGNTTVSKVTSSPNKKKGNVASPTKKKKDSSSSDEFSRIGKPTFTSSPRVTKRASVPVQRLQIVRNDSSTRAASASEVSVQKRRPAKGRGHSLLHRKGYSPHEDKAIVDYILKHRAERLVNGNEMWRKMEYSWPELCPSENKRSFHSLRNRYLRYLLPTAHLLDLPPDTIKTLRVGAHTGTIKNSRENSLLADKGGPRSAWSRRPRKHTTNSTSDVE